MKTFEDWWDENRYAYTNVAEYQAYQIWVAARESAAKIVEGCDVSVVVGGVKTSLDSKVGEFIAAAIREQGIVKQDAA